MAIDPSDLLTERDSGAAWVRKANKLLLQAGVDLGATEAARDAAGGHAAQADSAAASAASAAAMAAQIRGGQRQGGPLIAPTLLLDWANNPALDPRIRYTRAGDAWEANAAGILTRHGASSWAWSSGRRVWPALTNHCTCRTANPTDFSNISIVGPGSLPNAIVDATSELRSGGLSLICSSGRAYEIDASAEQSVRYVNVIGAPDGTTARTISAYVWGSGEVTLRLNSQASSEGVTASLTGIPRRIEATITPNQASQRNLQFVVQPGAKLRFILPQLVDGPYAGPAIPGDTLAATTRDADAPMLPTGNWFNQIEGTFVVRVRLAASRAPAGQVLLAATNQSSPGSLPGYSIFLEGNNGRVKFRSQINPSLFFDAWGGVYEGGVLTVVAGYAASGREMVVATGGAAGTRIFPEEANPLDKDQIYVGNRRDRVRAGAGDYLQFNYFPRLLSAAEMAALSQ